MLQGVKAVGNSLVFGPEWSELTLTPSLEERRTLAQSLLENFSRFPVMGSSPKTPEQQRAEDKLLNAAEKAWRKDKTREMTPAEQQAREVIYLCTICNYHIYGRWLSEDQHNFNLQFSGVYSKSANMFNNEERTCGMALLQSIIGVINP